MKTYTIFPLETPFIKDYAELETEVSQLVNDVLSMPDYSKHRLVNVQVERLNPKDGEMRYPRGIYTIFVHLIYGPST